MRPGWTTGACATAASAAAAAVLLGGGDFPDPVTITLPGGQRPAFALAECARGPDWAAAAVVKDAGDDPDVTHGALVRARLSHGAPGSGIVFRAGPGVGTVTRPGLPLAVGNAAINPTPRAMIADAITQAAQAAGLPLGRVPDVVVEIAIPGGELLARRTLNGRLGIVGGLSILGTTGIVVPYSCAAWIASIHRGVDVARAAGLTHVAASTGRTSERAVAAYYGLSEQALLDMGDFAGGTLKYLRRHPVPRLTIAGGFAKLGKLAQGRLDLHSKRHAVDLPWLAGVLADLGAPPDFCAAAAGANTALEVLDAARAAGWPVADRIAALARATALAVLEDAPVAVDVLVVDRQGAVIGTSSGDLHSSHSHSPHPHSPLPR